MSSELANNSCFGLENGIRPPLFASRQVPRPLLPQRLLRRPEGFDGAKLAETALQEDLTDVSP
jgi:hypothetical protein